MPGDDQESKKPKLQANLLSCCCSGNNGMESVRDENLRANLRANSIMLMIFMKILSYQSLLSIDRSLLINRNTNVLKSYIWRREDTEG